MVSIIFLGFKYHHANNIYTVQGKSGLCKANTVLLSNVTEYIHTKGDGLKLTNYPPNYDPFHEDIDIEERLVEENTVEENEVTDKEDMYIVENIVQRRFREDHYEYLVKWRGYADTDNTWEMPSNIYLLTF